MPPLDCSEQPECIKKFAILETKMDEVQDQNEKIFLKLDAVCPAVMENSWWIEKIKWGFVFVAVVGVVMGIVSWAMRGE